MSEVLQHPANVAIASRSDRVIDRLVAFFGTKRFLAYQSVVIVLWVAANVVWLAGRWDPYP